MSGSLITIFMSFKLSVSDAVGLISKTFESKNKLLALNTFCGYAVSLPNLSLKCSMPGLIQLKA